MPVLWHGTLPLQLRLGLGLTRHACRRTPRGLRLFCYVVVYTSPFFLAPYFNSYCRHEDMAVFNIHDYGCCEWPRGARDWHAPDRRVDGSGLWVRCFHSVMPRWPQCRCKTRGAQVTDTDCGIIPHPWTSFPEPRLAFTQCVSQIAAISWPFSSS